MRENVIVNLSSESKYPRVEIVAERRGQSTTWDISIFSFDRIWLGDGIYVAEYGRGIEDCDANFSDLDYRLMDEALGLMVIEVNESAELYAEMVAEREQELRLNAQDWKHW